jgi:hypothetical protein
MTSSLSPLEFVLVAVLATVFLIRDLCLSISVHYAAYDDTLGKRPIYSQQRVCRG